MEWHNMSLHWVTRHSGILPEPVEIECSPN